MCSSVLACHGARQCRCAEGCLREKPGRRPYNRDAGALSSQTTSMQPIHRRTASQLRNSAQRNASLQATRCLCCTTHDSDCACTRPLALQHVHRMQAATLASGGRCNTTSDMRGTQAKMMQRGCNNGCSAHINCASAASCHQQRAARLLTRALTTSSMCPRHSLANQPNKPQRHGASKRTMRTIARPHSITPAHTAEAALPAAAAHHRVSPQCKTRRAVSAVTAPPHPPGRRQ